MKFRHVYRIPPCPTYDVEGMESWLTDMAAQGLFLCQDGFFAGFAAFERGEPRPMRYRLEPSPKAVSLWSDDGGQPDPEAKALGEHYGWRYLAAWGQFFIYASDQPGARELNTDPIVQSMALDLVCKRQRRDFIVSLFWPILYILLFFRGGVLELLLEMGAWRFLWAVILVLWGTWASFSSLHSLGRLRKKLAAGQPLNHRKNWKRRARAHRLSALLFTVLTAAWFFGFLNLWKADIMETNVRSLSEDPGPYPFATLADLAEDGTFYREDGYQSNRSERRSDWLAPEIIDYRENGGGTTPDGQPFSGGLDVKYYRLASAGLARELYRELLAKAPRERHYAPLSLPSLDADQQAAYTGYFPTLFLQKGDKVIQITFYQLTDSAIPLEDWAAVFASGF